LPTLIGPDQLAWQGEPFAGRRLPEIAHGGAPPPNESPPPRVATIIERVQRHLLGSFQDFRGLLDDFATGEYFPQTV